MKKLGVFVILFSLAGCGGSSNVNKYSVIKLFPDGVGVVAGIDGNTSRSISTNAVATVAGANAPNTSTDRPISSLPIINTYSHGRIRSGVITNGNGVAASVRVYEDSSGDADAAYYSIPGSGNIIETTTKSYTAPAGTYTYTGLFAASYRSLNPATEYGSFTMSADFSAKRISFIGKTATFQLNGNAVLDSNAGTFNSNAFTFSYFNYNYPASIYGLMGGNGATATSGVFHTNDYNVDYAGAFVGHR